MLQGFGIMGFRKYRCQELHGVGLEGSGITGFRNYRVEEFGITVLLCFGVCKMRMAGGGPGEGASPDGV